MFDIRQAAYAPCAQVLAASPDGLHRRSVGGWLSGQARCCQQQSASDTQEYGRDCCSVLAESAGLISQTLVVQVSSTGRPWMADPDRAGLWVLVCSVCVQILQVETRNPGAVLGGALAVAPGPS